MSDEMKLIMALCDAMGFDVEEVVTTVHPPFSIIKACFTDRYNQQGPVHTVDYKLNKRKGNNQGVKTTEGLRGYLRECFDGNNEPMHYCDDCSAERELNPDDVRIADINE
jgi:hypothetical protein